MEGWIFLARFPKMRLHISWDDPKMWNFGMIKEAQTLNADARLQLWEHWKEEVDSVK